MVPGVNQQLAAALDAFGGVAVAIMYGSRATGKARPDSDVDVAVAMEGPLTWELYCRLHAYLEEALALPVDLVDLTQAHAILLDEIFDEGVVVRKANREIYAQQIIRRMGENADFMPQYRAILKRRRERFFAEPLTPS